MLPLVDLISTLVVHLRNLPFSIVTIKVLAVHYLVVVTHELASIFAIANNSVFLDAKTKTMIASGDPHELLLHGPDDVVEFLTRGKGRDSGDIR